MADPSPPTFVPGFQSVHVPLDWLTGGRLPPVCVLTGAPTGGHLQRTELALPGAVAGTGPLVGDIRGLWGYRRVPVLLPAVPGAFDAMRRRRWIVVGACAAAPVTVMMLTHELLGWREGAMIAGLAAFLVVAVPGVLVLLLRDLLVSDAKDGLVGLRVPSREAARAIRAALAAEGACPPLVCRKCGASSTDGAEGIGSDTQWYCARCSADPPSRGGPKRRPFWIAFPMSVAILLFVMPPVLTWFVLARMRRGAADFLAGCAVLGGLAAVFVPWPGIAMAVAPSIAILLTGAAWLLVRRTHEAPVRKAFGYAVALDLVALVVVVSRVLMSN